MFKISQYQWLEKFSYHEELGAQFPQFDKKNYRINHRVKAKNS